MSATYAEVFPPGEFIREELATRGWTQADLAAIVGWPLNTLYAIIRGKKSITPQTAVALGQAFGTSAELWLNLESAYRLSLVDRSDNEVERRAKLFELQRTRIQPRLARTEVHRKPSIDAP